MGDVIYDLQFKIELNKKIARKESFEQILQEPGFILQFSDFLNSKIGKIWIKSPQGQEYQKWQADI